MGVVRVTRDLQGTDLIQPYSLQLQDIGEGEHGEPGVTVSEGMEERHVQVGPGRARRQGYRLVGAVTQTTLKVPPSVWGECVPLPATLGEGVALSERDLRQTEDKLLPASQQLESEGAPPRCVCAGLSQGRKQSVGSGRIGGTLSRNAPVAEAVHSCLDRSLLSHPPRKSNRPGS